MIIRIRQDAGKGTIYIAFKFTSRFAREHEVIKIESWPIGRTEEEIGKAIVERLKYFKNIGKLRY